MCPNIVIIKDNVCLSMTLIPIMFLIIQGGTGRAHMDRTRLTGFKGTIRIIFRMMKNRFLLRTTEVTSSMRGRKICTNNNLLLEYSFSESFDSCVKLYLNQYLFCGAGFRGSSFKAVHK